MSAPSREASEPGQRCYQSRGLVLLVLLLLAVSHSAPSAGAPSNPPIEPASTEFPPVFLAQWGSVGTDERQFNEPRGVAVDAAGNVYVADTDNHRIQKFDNDGTFLRMWGFGVDNGLWIFQICTAACQVGVGGPGDGQFKRPHDVAVDAAGNVYVADSYNSRVQKFSSDGTYLAKWGTQGVGWTGFDHPQGVAVNASGHVYISDLWNARIKKHNAVGAFGFTWGWGVRDGTVEYQVCGTLSPCQAGIAGSGDGQFSNPEGVAVDVFGNVYVADSVNHRIQKFDSGVTFVAKWGSFGSGAGELKQPSGVAVDTHGNVYVADTGSSRIQKFDSDGKFLIMWGTQGSGDGDFDSPHGLAVDGSGNIFVSDRLNNRIQKFGGPWLDVFIGAPEMPRDR